MTCKNIVLSLCVVGAVHCSKKETSEGLPAAQEWQVPDKSDANGGENKATANTALKNSQQNPHGDPHAGLNLDEMIQRGNDPHAGLDLKGMTASGADPHGGLEMDPEMAKFDPPDPNRNIDTSKFLTGTVNIKKEYLAGVSEGAVVFYSVRPIDKLTGDVIGSPLAVEIEKNIKWPMSFHLSEVNMMVDGTDFTGDVEVYVRVDGDGEARTKEPGDVEGSVKTTIPQKNLNIVLNNRLR